MSGNTYGLFAVLGILFFFTIWYCECWVVKLYRIIIVPTCRSWAGVLHPPALPLPIIFVFVISLLSHLPSPSHHQLHPFMPVSSRATSSPTSSDFTEASGKAEALKNTDVCHSTLFTPTTQPHNLAPGSLGFESTFI
ncbi:hypothetical protein EX30DRAFT_52283 [Ascodesmis nigricans]|uniref:Uncharacterized protein n=1 Tax=Ascodesmis nigricans TaxID=341454 RepID=A0A4S2MV71_9PEZI|nr:hypothetical protein EX30DRAFT_52283 [Ascodesmis nigricans]